MTRCARGHQIVTCRLPIEAYRKYYRTWTPGREKGRTMETRFTKDKWRSDGGGRLGGRCSDTSARRGAFSNGLELNIWHQGCSFVTLTTRSFASHDGIPVLRVTDPTYHDSVDLGPAEFAPCREDEPPETAAELLVHIHAHGPLTGQALEGARRFLGQWPDGPQLPEAGRVPAPAPLSLESAVPPQPLSSERNYWLGLVLGDPAVVG